MAYTRPGTWDGNLHISYLLPVTSVLAPPLPMTPAMTPAPPMVPPPLGVMSPSSPPETETPQVDGGLPDNQLLQPGQTHSRTRAYHQAFTSAPSADTPHSVRRIER